MNETNNQYFPIYRDQELDKLHLVGYMAKRAGHYALVGAYKAVETLVDVSDRLVTEYDKEFNHKASE